MRGLTEMYYKQEVKIIDCSIERTAVFIFAVNTKKKYVLSRFFLRLKNLAFVPWCEN
jgi:hypothetical protein